MKRRLRNLSKGRLAAILVVVCALAFGGYFGYHKFFVHAANTINKGVVNTLQDYYAMCGGQDKADNPSEAAGSENNPFLILEVVPYYGQAEVGYLINGCEPLDFTETNPFIYRGASDFTRAGADVVFTDEYQRDANNDGVSDEEWSSEWKVRSVTQQMKDSGNKYEVKGYYEKTSNGKPGDFVIDTYYEDTSQNVIVKDENGIEKRVHPWRPHFKKVEAGTGDFIWVSLEYSGMDGSIDFNKYAKAENQTTVENGTIDYKPGDREFTTRSLLDEDQYYAIQDTPKGESVFVDGIAKVHVVNMNDFIRISLNPDDKSEAAIQDMKIAVKTIEPQELAQNPQWIDYANLIYMHESPSVGVYQDWWFNQRGKEGVKARLVNDNSYYKDQESSMSRQNVDQCAFSGSNDWSWEAAKKLFFKINELDEYAEGGKNEKFGFAPLLLANVSLNRLKGISSSVYGDKCKNLMQQHLDYTTMETGGTEKTDTPSTSCNVYKFFVMNFLMDQTNFYSYFFQTVRDSGGYVINADNGKCTPQKGEAQDYWSFHSFLPIEEGNGNLTQEQMDLYKIYHSGLNYMYFDKIPALANASFVYNSDTSLSQRFSSTGITEADSNCKDAFDWWEETYGVRPGHLSSGQIVHYLLQYKRNNGGGGEVRPKDKKTMHVLEIEPCADFIMTEKYLTGKYLPATNFKGQIEVDHMTTAEFNGLRRDLNGYYDLIYIGDNIGKFNSEEVNEQNPLTNAWGKTNRTRYNVSGFDGYAYLHVGDMAGKYRSSGNDITKRKMKQLLAYARGGNALVLADNLAVFKWKSAGSTEISNAYEKAYLSRVDTASNMHTLIQEGYKGAKKWIDGLKSNNDGANGFTRDNICSLSKLDKSFLSKYCLNYMDGGFALPKRTQTSMTTKDYKAMTKKYSDYVGLYSRIDSAPVQYYSEAGLTDTDDVNMKSADDKTVARQSLAGSSLDFSFTIGDQTVDKNNNLIPYAARLYIDLNGDGIISDDELVEDTNSAEVGSLYCTYTYVGEAEKGTDGNPLYKDKSGEGIKIPVTQSFSYDFANNSRLYLNKTRKSGAISWKFVLYRTDNEDNYQSATGVSRYERKDSGGNNAQNSINALQIVSDAQLNTNANLQTQLKDSSSLFATYTDDTNLPDYKVQVTTVGLSEFMDLVNTSKVNSTSTTGEDYNCFIVSCASELCSKSEGDYQKAAKYLVARADSGVRVVYTGEAVNEDNKSAETKDLLNMSRYTGSDTYYGDISDTANGLNDKKNEYQNRANHEYTYAKIMSMADSEKYKLFNGTKWKVDYKDPAEKTENINRNNRGLLTTYPYTLDKQLDITKTSAQTYQLNMENEGLTVWYSLGTAGDGNDTDEYDISPRDASNNYYMYSVENVVYDQIDLAKVTDAKEMKLFINALSGSTASPEVVVEEAKSVNTNYNDFKNIKNLTKDYFENSMSADGTKRSEDGLEMSVYAGSIKPIGSNYKDYEADASEVTPVPSGAPGSATDAPDAAATEAPTQAPTQEPTATPKPRKTPIILYSDPKGGQYMNDGNKASSFSEEEYKKWSDDDCLIVDYSYEPEDSNVQNAFKYYSKNNWNNQKYLPAKTQVKAIKLGDLKSELNITTAQLNTLGFYSYENGNTKVYCVGIFEDEEHYQEYKSSAANSNSGSGGGSSTPMDKIEEKESDVNLVPTGTEMGAGFVPNGKTHKVSFTPYTNSADCVNVNSFAISKVVASADKLGSKDENSIGHVDAIYQDVAGSVWKYEASADHTFTIKKNNFLKDKAKYYFYINDSFINNVADFTNDKTRWVRFDISNRRRSAITYLHLYYQGDLDTTYVFPLD